MTEMSAAEPAPGAGGGGKQDPVVPDVVVYVCSFIIVVMVVGGVVALSMLMKKRLDVSQNVTTVGPAAPGAPPPKARLVSIDDSESNDFKVFNDDDPFHYRVAKARDGYHRKVPFYEAAHSKQKSKKHKKPTPVKTPKRKAPTTRRRTTKAPAKVKTKRVHTTRAAAKTTAKHGKKKTHIAKQKKEKVEGPTKVEVNEVGAENEISDVGVAGVEIKAKKTSAKDGRSGSGDTADGIEISAKKTKAKTSNEGAPQVVAKKVSPKEKKHKALVETMKVLLEANSEAQPPNISIDNVPVAHAVPDKVNLSDVSDIIPAENTGSESADSGVGATERNVTIKLLQPAGAKTASKADETGSHNQSSPVAEVGSPSVKATASNESLGNTSLHSVPNDKPVLSNSSFAIKPLGNTSLANSSSMASGAPFEGSLGDAAAAAKSPADKPAENPQPGNSTAGHESAVKAPSADAVPPASSAANKSSLGNSSVDHGTQAANVQPVDASGGGKSADELPSPVKEGPPGGAAPGAEVSAADESAGKQAGVVPPAPARGTSTNTSAGSGSSSLAKKEAADVPGAPSGQPSAPGPESPHDAAAKPHDVPSVAKDKGDSALPNQAASDEKEADKSRDTAANEALAPGPSAQRPLFCEVSKAITRSLASYCTHILFGRIPLVTQDGEITVGDMDSRTKEQLHLVSMVRPGWPHVSLLTTLGGGGEKENAHLARAFEAGGPTLDALATRAANLVRSRGLDGLNLHWSVPDLEGDVEAHAKGLLTFVKKLRKELGPSSIITVVVPNEREERNAAFNVRALQPFVDYLFVSTHDTFNPYSTLTRFNGPAQDIDTGGMFTAIADVLKELNASRSRQLCFTFGLSGVSYKVEPGVSLAKYVPLVDHAGAKSSQVAARMAQLPQEGRPITYDEVCKLNLTCHRAHVEKSCYDKVGDTWYGFVDEEAVASKAKWLLKDGWENLCVVAWHVDSDDVKGSCRGNADTAYPLLRSLSQATAELAY
ncbi:uncharacterized protein LOC144125018 isoform X2 [Amblyomma americanum]